MDKIWLTIILILTLFFVFALCQANTTPTNEQFVGRYGAPCSVCSDHSYAKCLDCTNCGYCLNDNGGKCIPGDVHGPYNPQIQCKMWYQNDWFSKPLYYQNHPRL